MNLILYKLMTLWYQVIATENRLNCASCLADSLLQRQRNWSWPGYEKICSLFLGSYEEPFFLSILLFPL